MSILTFHCEPARSHYTRYRLDPVFDRMPDGAVIGIIRYHIYLDGRFVGSRRTHAQCHNLLDELMPQPLTQNAMGRPSICLRHDQGGVLVGDVKDARIDRHKDRREIRRVARLDFYSR